MPNIKFAFFGTPEIAVDTLDILKNSGFTPSVIITARDMPRGRKLTITPPPVKVWAENNNIPVFQPDKLDQDFALQLSTFNFELSVVVAYGKIFPEWLINLPRLGTLNIHYSLLPTYRGASPVQSAILNGDKITGVTIQQMQNKLDAGPIIAQEEVVIDPNEKTPELLKKLTEIGGELLVKTLPDYLAGKTMPRKQDDNQATLCKKIRKEDGLIDLNGNSINNYNKFRAFFEWPRSYFFRDKKRIIITDAKLENGILVIKKILPEGKKEISWR